MRAVTASLARVAKPRAGVAPRGRSASCPSRRGWRTSSQRVFSSSTSDASAREDDAPPPQGVTRLPRERASHGPTYAFGAAGTPEAKGALRLRFLAFHGCGARFTVLLRDRPEPSEAGGSSPESSSASAARAGAAIPGPRSRGVFEAPRAKKNDGGVREAGVAVPALDAFDGAALVRLALFDEDLGSRRMYAREDARRWSARRAAPLWPRRVLDALDASGGVSGADALVCVDGGYFLELARLSAFPTPVLFPHGAWRLRGAGPGVGPEGSFRAFAEAFRGVDAVAALRAAARGALRDAGVGDDASETTRASNSDFSSKIRNAVLAATPGRVTGEIPSRGRSNLGDAGGAAGLDAALDAVSDRVATVRFPDGPLGLGFAPYDWDEGTGAQVWEVDDGSVAARNGVVAGMTFRSMRLAESAETTSCSETSFEDIDAAFDAPRPIEVTFQSKAPNVERLYAVEMRAEHVAGGLQTKKTESSAAESAAEFREPGAAFAAATVWREARATVFVGDAGSGTPPHHDIVAQIELCHVMHGSKMLAAAPWGEPSDELLRRARPGDDDDDNDDDDDEEEDESLLTVPTHRALTEPERAILERTPELCVVHARPGDTVAFSSAAAHFAVNGAAEPCACAFHGVLTPASAHTLAAHFERLDPFSREELAAAGFSEHLTGRLVLTKEMRETGEDVARRDAANDAARDTAESQRLRSDEIGRDAEEVLAARFLEAARRMDEARDAARSGDGKAPSGTAVEAWPEARRTTFFA